MKTATTLVVLSICLFVIQSSFASDVFFERLDTTSNETTVYTTVLSSTQNVTVQLTDESTNGTLLATFPPIGNFSADYSLAAFDIPDYQNPNSTDSGTYKDFGFFITLFYQNSTQVTDFTFETPVVLKLNVSGVSSNYRLFLYNTTSQLWEDAARTCSSYFSEVVDGVLVVHVCHFTQFGVFEVASGTTGTARLQLSSSGSNSGLIAAVIIIPILIVLIIIGLVAWALLRNPKSNGNDNNSTEVEMKNKKKRSSDEDKKEEQEEETPKQVELAVSTSNDAIQKEESETESESNSSESEV